MDQGGQNGNSRPLYLQIRDLLIERIRSGEWAPGESIPTEPEIAQHYGVGHGTARQAVTELAREILVVRRQGYGTLVFEHTPDNVLSRFFYFFDTMHRQIVPDAGGATTVVAKANAEERKELRLGKSARVIRISRVRTRGGRPFVVEAISLPEARFQGLASRDPIPNTLYDIYQTTHRVHVARADERVTAAAADRPTARLLGIATGTPLLRLESIAYALDARPVELRVSLCHMDRAYYLAHRK